MFQTWSIPKSSVHVVLRDNAKNMVKAMSDANLPSLPCVAHTLQLVFMRGFWPREVELMLWRSDGK